MKDLSIDLETWSTVDIAKAGHYRYIMDDSFEILLFGVKVDEEPTIVYDLTKEEPPDWLVEALKDPAVTKHAWNASFEINALNRCGYFTPVTQWQDTMIHAAYLGFPLKLETAGKALGLSEDKRKLATGKALIRYFSRPCKPTKTNGRRARNLPHHDPEKWDLYIEYNRQDVESEHYIEYLLSDIPVPDSVWNEWYEDFSVNYRGVRIDDRLVENAINFDERSAQELTERATELTGLENVKSNAQMLAWLRENYSEDVTSVAKGTVEGILQKDDLPEKVREVLLLRQKMAKSSTAKYLAMERAVCADGRIRGLLQFYGAAHTGRFAGRLVQMQNLPRNYLSTLDDAREMVRRGEYQNLKMVYGNVPDTLSQLIRTAFVPSEGGKFIVSDFSAIEARTLAWIAGEQSVLDSFLRGDDIYCHMASQMFGVPVEKHGVNGELRQKGKIAILACGYGGSVGAMVKMGALNMGLTEDELPGIVQMYREANPHIVSFWWELEKAAKGVVQNYDAAGVDVRCLHLRMVEARSAEFLVITLPSGRELFYCNPFLQDGSLVYYGTNQTTRKFEPIETYGGRLAENVTQAVARDCLCVTLSRVIKAGYRPVMHIHDEIIIDADQDQSLDDVNAIFAEPIPWAPGLPLKGDGFEGNYYMKD